MEQQPPKPIAPVLSAAQRIWEGQVCCDMEVESECGKKIPCHSSFLCASSEFFSANHRFRQNSHTPSQECSGSAVTKISGIRLNVLRVCLMSCYDYPPALTKDNVVDLIYAADQLQMDSLGAKCEEFCRNASRESQASILAQMPGKPETPIRTRVVKYLMERLSRDLYMEQSTVLSGCPVAAKLVLEKTSPADIGRLQTRKLRELGRIPDCSDVLITALKSELSAAPGIAAKSIEQELSRLESGTYKKNIPGIQKALACVRRRMGVPAGVRKASGRTCPGRARR
mmetsp:Transcript_7705/g.17824  ORF Transcript_7705/g.17824 Transcript_7705/m.17824 type:complete len:284 (-) Transcript_7705:240-1091(-)